MAQLSLFIGDIRPLPDSGRPTGMFKQPVRHTLELGRTGFVGDHQADRVHGGPEKAVHLYPAQHYQQLARRFPEIANQLQVGTLGENISSADLTEQDVRIGDIYQLGSARLQVCQPRNPCWKIDARFACDGLAAFIAEASLTGWYWRVLQPGQVSPGDALLLQQSSNAPSLAASMQLWQSHRPAIGDLEALAALPGLASEWQKKILARTAWLRDNSL
jgi:MOSC domain-containing protein YiiM